MVKNKDKWSALSMKERADLIKLYVSNGITSLDNIKKDYNSFAPGGSIETDEYGYPADITPAVVTQDAEFNKFLITLPDNQRLTPEEDYHTYQYWKINGKPKDFSEALNLGMYHYDSSDNSYHANSVAFDSKGVGHFMKPKHHPTVKYELDWYNKGIGTLEGGKQYPLQGEERKEWEDFRSQYQLDSTGVDYKYVPRKHHNSFGDGGNIDTSTPLKSRQQYLEQQRQQIIDAAIQNSYDREFPEIPHTLKFENENKWREYMESKINEANNLIENAPYEGMAEIYRERLRGLEDELAKGYTPELCEGPTCIYTTTGNFGKQYQVAGNRSFRGNPAKYGFVEVGLNEIKPGDVVQDFSKKDGVPTHALMFVGFDSNGKALFNYSDGRFNESAIEKDAYYPFINSSVHLTSQNSDRLKHAAAAYRFIGNEEDNINWNNEFVNYRKNYTDTVTKELKQVPTLQLPVFLENNNFLKLK